MSEISFQCAELYPESHVAGRNCGGDIQVGDTFTAITRTVFPPTDPSEPLITPPHEFVAPVTLRLDTIKLYGRYIDFLSPGMTALLGLSGSGLELLSDNLAHAPPRSAHSTSAGRHVYLGR